MSSEDNKLLSQQKYLWEYFKAHAAQRLTTFNFYILIFTFLCTGYTFTFRERTESDFLARVFISILLIIFSYIFYMLDKRNKIMIKDSENALKVVEKKLHDSGDYDIPCQCVFNQEQEKTEYLRNHVNPCPCAWLDRNLSYGECFRIIFILGGVVGIFGIITAICLLPETDGVWLKLKEVINFYFSRP